MLCDQDVGDFLFVTNPNWQSSLPDWWAQQMQEHRQSRLAALVLNSSLAHNVLCLAHVQNQNRRMSPQ
jgi:hypothetical protein